ncbi:MAG: hypothetical protein KF878_01340 [Planctomycetes bacterium]|nr:hypothetical protein [Planctomycetota bacterium]
MLHAHDVALRSCVRALDDDELFAEELDELRAAVDAALVDALPEVVVAWLLAGHLSAEHADAITQQLQRLHGPELAVTPRALVPIRPPDRTTFGDDVRLTTNPETTTPPTDRTLRFTLAPDDLRGVEVTLSWGLDGALAPVALRPDLRLGAACPAPLAPGNLDKDSYERGDQPLFYDVRPTDRERVRAEILELLERARESRAHLVVLPELLVDDALLATLEGWLRPGEAPFGVVAGSRHVPRSDRDQPGENVTTLLTTGGRHEHRKYAPYVIREAGGLDRHEDIWPKKRLRLLVSGRSSVLLLVCKDFLDAEATALATALRATLVLVPALTDRTGEFCVRAEQLVLDCQATTLVANGLRAAGASTAIVARPVRTSTTGPRAFTLDPQQGSSLTLVTLGDPIVDVRHP